MVDLTVRSFSLGAPVGHILDGDGTTKQCRSESYDQELVCDRFEVDHVATLKANFKASLVDAYEAVMPNRVLDQLLVEAPKDFRAIPPSASTWAKIKSGVAIVAGRTVKGVAQDLIELPVRSAMLLSDGFDVVTGAVAVALTKAGSGIVGGVRWIYDQP
jgi:hypothetical protein